MKKLITGVSLIVILLSQLSYGEDITQLWAKTYNGMTNSEDAGNAIAVDNGGNVYVAGYETVTGWGTNIWIKKYDSNGMDVWVRSYNGNANKDDKGNGITVDNSGNVYVTGFETVNGQGTNVWIRKYDSNGNEVWTKTYNGIANGDDAGNAVAVDNSGNVYVTGYETIAGEYENIWTRKYDVNGTEVWTKTYNGAVNAFDTGNAIVTDSKGNVYVTGREAAAGQGWNVWTRKYDSYGTELWTKTYNGKSNGDDVGNGIALDARGNVYVTGFEGLAKPGWDIGNIWTKKYDSYGTDIWTKANGVNGVATGIAVDSSGNAYITGSEGLAGTSNILLKKYDSFEIEVWVKTFGPHALGKGIAVDNNGNVYVTGYETDAGQGLNVTVRKYNQLLFRK